MNEMNKKRGQVTIFIIIAIVVVGLIALFFLFSPQIRPLFDEGVTNPHAFIQNCLEEDIENVVDELSLKGGEIEPESFYLYKGDKIRYLCYTNEYYQTCVVQESMLKESIEKEIKEAISLRIEECFDDLEEEYKKQGYDVDLNRGEISVELLPKRIVTKIDSTLTLTKDTSKTYDSFMVVLNNNLYELIGVAKSILNYESTIGNMDVTMYMNYYRDLKVEKITQDEGTKIYIITDRNNNNKFQFASRSIAWPAGYLNNE